MAMMLKKFIYFQSKLFIMRYIDFPKNHQTQFLKFIKKKTKHSWKKIAYFLRVSRSMIYFYLNEHSKLPFDHYVKLCKLAKTKKKNIKTVEIKNKEEKIKIPHLTNKLAEFIGALAGDGHLSKVSYEVSITVDKNLDKDYSDHIIYLYKYLFNIKAKKYIQQNKVKCYASSKKLIEFLTKQYAIPRGKKKEKLHIPEKIKLNENLLKSYIRGVFDTDGTIHRHHKKDAMLGLISRDKKFIEELKIALDRLNFNSSLNNKNLYIYKKEQIDKFFKEIKPSNVKHQKKYLYYKRFGRVPLTKELSKR